VLVIAADTTVADGQEILGKPRDAADAERILRQLRGRIHQVFTGIAVAHNGHLSTDLSASDVPMRNYSDAEMLAYIKSGDPMDKAGAYAIQHAGFHPAENFSDCFANVMGFPLCHLTRTVKKFTLSLPADLPDSCQETIGYQCPVFEQILREST
jgi:MAF protein